MHMLNINLLLNKIILIIVNIFKYIEYMLNICGVYANYMLHKKHTNKHLSGPFGGKNTKATYTQHMLNICDNIYRNLTLMNYLHMLNFKF